jgi:hypothetical protein
MKKKINVVVVDDLPMYARLIENVLYERNQKSNDYEYVCNVFCADTHFADAEKFILENLTKIDIIFSDYHLDGGGNGLDLFNIFKENLTKPYRILHSNTSQRFTEHSTEFINNLYDEFCRSKAEEEIEEKVLLYEREILPIKLFGNPLFYRYYYDKQFQPKKDALRKIGEFTIMDIMSITTKNDNHTIIFRHHSKGITNILKSELTGPKYRQGAIIEDTDGMPYARLNQSQLVNLLWVSEINIHHKKVKFISSDSGLRKMDIFNFSKEKPYNQTYNEYLLLLSSNISRFFL